jgi:hypothetical protein
MGINVTEPPKFRVFVAIYLKSGGAGRLADLKVVNFGQIQQACRKILALACPAAPLYAIPEFIGRGILSGRSAGANIILNASA